MVVRATTPRAASDEAAEEVAISGFPIAGRGPRREPAVRPGRGRGPACLAVGDHAGDRRPVGCPEHPASVTIAVTRSAGVTSNEGFTAAAPAGAARRPANEVTSPAERISTVIPAPSGVSPSRVAVGATT